MESLPDEIVLLIFSYVPAKNLFQSVSVVSKTFNRLAYDCFLVRRSGRLLEKINLERKSKPTMQKVRDIIAMLPSTTVKYISIQDCFAAWEVLDVLAATCKSLRILNLASSREAPKLSKKIKPFMFSQLLELNVSYTLIDDNFIHHLSQSCKKLYSLNMSHCPNVTDTGLTTVSFNLTLLNIAHCHLQFETVVYTLREFDVQVLCMQGICTGLREGLRLVAIFPLCLELGIPTICGFTLPGYQDCQPRLCFWCKNSSNCTFLTSDDDPDKVYEI